MKCRECGTDLIRPFDDLSWIYLCPFCGFLVQDLAERRVVHVPELLRVVRDGDVQGTLKPIRLALREFRNGHRLNVRMAAFHCGGL